MVVFRGVFLAEEKSTGRADFATEGSGSASASLRLFFLPLLLLMLPAGKPEEV